MEIPKIISARITDLPKQLFDPMPEVIATFSDGETRTLFKFYPDEISFQASEFVGLTAAEAFALRHKKDVEYLRS